MSCKLLSPLLLAAASACAVENWAVPSASVRFHLNLGQAPTHPSAGYFVTLPDGGILPGPRPGTRVFDSAGKELKSGVLWRSKDTGLGLVFAPPTAAGEVLVYVESSPQLRLWTPDTGLTPSALLCTAPGAGDRQSATRLGQLGEVEPDTHFLNRAGVPKAPLSVPGDLSGRAGPCALYMLAHLVTTDPGETWFAPLTFDGGSEVRVDGKALQLKKVSGKPGGTGDSIALSNGLHRVEIFCWAPRSNADNGLMTLTWRTPNTKPQELGGIRPSDLPHAGTSMWDSRPLRPNEIVRSGEANVRSAEAIDGRPLARVELTAIQNFWVENETPLLAYRLRALEAGNPEGTTYTWSLGRGGRVAKTEAFWLFPGDEDQRVTLTASRAAQKSTCSFSFRPFATMRTDLNDPMCRQDFRRAATEMVEAVPAAQDPTADWTASHWNNFFRTLELGKGQPMLTGLLSARWDVISRKLTPEQRRLVREIYLDNLSRKDPAAALQWTEKAEQTTGNAFEAGMMRITRAELLAYYLGKPDEARALLDGIVRARASDDLCERARIRLGDLEFLAGRLNEATALYGEVQTRSSKTRAKLGSGAPATGQPAAPTVKTVQEVHAAMVQPTERVADWKVNALLDAAVSEKVKSLLAQGYLLEARGELQQWEREFPLSKVSGDYLINEARLYMALEDWKRADAILQAYCQNTDASSYLPTAVELAIRCKRARSEPATTFIPFCKSMKKKLEFHPVAGMIDDMLRTLGDTGT